MLGMFLSSSSNSSPSRRLLPSFCFPESSRTLRSLCRLCMKIAPNIIRIRAMRPVVVPAMIAVRRETRSFEFDWANVVGRSEVDCKSLIGKKKKKCS